MRFFSSTACRPRRARPRASARPRFVAAFAGGSLLLAGCGSSSRTIRIPTFVGEHDYAYNFISPTLSNAVDVFPAANGTATGNLQIANVGLLQPIDTSLPGSEERNAPLSGAFDLNTGKFSLNGRYQVGATAIPVSVTGRVPDVRSTVSDTLHPEGSLVVTVNNVSYSSYEGRPYTFRLRFKTPSGAPADK